MILHTNPTIPLNVSTHQSGLHKLHLSFNGQQLVLAQHFDAGDWLYFDGSQLNEDYHYSCVVLEYPDQTKQNISPFAIRIQV